MVGQYLKFVLMTPQDGGIMPRPETHLYCAPSRVEDTFGNSLTSKQIIDGLHTLNHKINAPDPEHYDWYPLKKSECLNVIFSHTSLWLGPPHTGIKITAFPLGTIPEYSQLGPNGQLIVKGYRAIFEKCIQSGFVKRKAVEQHFGIVLSYDGTDGSCPQCRKEGNITGAAHLSGLCEDCEDIRLMVAKDKETTIVMSEFQPGLLSDDARKVERSVKELDEWQAY